MFPTLTSTTTLGYLAFPTGITPVLLQDEATRTSGEEVAIRAEQEAQEAHRQRDKIEAAAWKAEQERMKELHKARLAREAEEARKGEEYWVSCGGVLRDEHGRRDLERTQKIREELKLRELEKRLTERWGVYEKRWRDLLLTAKRQKLDDIGSEVGSSVSDAGSQVEDDPIKFLDIPWPVDTGDTTARPEDITFHNVQQFLIEGLTVRGCTTSKKERVRSSLLRWHPDKMTAIVSMVDPAEKEAVMDGIHAVIHCLQRLNSKV